MYIPHNDGRNSRLVSPLLRLHLNPGPTSPASVTPSGYRARSPVAGHVYSALTMGSKSNSKGGGGKGEHGVNKNYWCSVAVAINNMKR